MTFSELKKTGIEDLCQKDAWKLESELRELGFTSDYGPCGVRLSHYARGNLTQIFISEQNKYSGLITVRIL